MTTIRMLRSCTIDVDPSTRRAFPVGWSGEVAADLLRQLRAGVDYEGPGTDPPEPPQTEPTDADIIEAIRDLDPDDRQNWTASGSPSVEALERQLGCDISARQRDAAWRAWRASGGA